MLFDIDRNREIEIIPYENEYNVYMSRLSEAEILEIKSDLNGLIDGDEIHTAGWLPGADWTGKSYEAIYKKAARYNVDIAAKCFGLMVWVVFMERPEWWSSGRYEKDGMEIGSRTYFRIDR